MELQKFFNGNYGVRRSLFRHRLTTRQVSGMERIIKAFDTYVPNGTIQQLAYILSTSYHETAARMQPVRETLASSDNKAIKALDKAWDRGQLTWVKEPYWREGYFGRGDVQLTHKYNYEGPIYKAVLRKFPGKDISKNPELALDPNISAFIMIEGMMIGVTGSPDFTRYSLEQYVNKNKVDYFNARKSVNPGDRPTYSLLANYAEKFEAALKDAGYKQ